ncbi:TPA: hypothetical protein ACX6Q4_003912 [Photobacterium damselae]
MKFSLFIQMVVGFSLSMFALNASAQNVRNDVPSCAFGIDREYYQLPNERELIILVDRTMAHSLSNDIKSSLFNDIERFIQPGDTVQFIEFSSFAQDSYTRVVFKGQLDVPLTSDVRNNIKKSKLKAFDKCLGQQYGFMLAKLGQSFKASFEPQDKPTNTELMGTLIDISKQVVTKSSAQRKVVVLISDMLENSDVTSFYSRNQTRVIDPTKEIGLVKQANMFANFNGADVYVVGTGVIPGNDQYISAQKMAKLETFWSDYFKNSQAHLRGFGKPMLLSEIR